MKRLTSSTSIFKMRENLLTPSLIDPAASTHFSLVQWDLLLRQARQSNLLARLAALLEQHALLEHVPPQPREHLLSALAMAQRQQQAVYWEITCIRRALANLQMPFILLKGAAYILLQLPNARGRLFSDIDILVPKDRLEEVELSLKMHGWITTLHDAYDQRYYREWMHELPPMTHLQRQTSLDVHHTILPETARLHPDAGKLFADAQSLPDFPLLQTLSPVDMVLHSATHLFHEGEFDKGLRDLCDLDALLRYYSQEDTTFWTRLVLRAQVLDLARPLFYALRYTSRLLATPVPDEVQQGLQPNRPNAMLLRLMDQLFLRAFQPNHQSCKDSLTRPALYLLFVRSHWLKMPFFLLIRHLLHKALFSPMDTRI